VFVHSKAGGIADDGITGAGEGKLRVACDVRRQARKYDLAIERRFYRKNLKFANAFGHIARKFPCTRLGIDLSRGTFGRRKRRNFELRMPLQKLYKTLPDRPGRTQYPDSVFSRHKKRRYFRYSIARSSAANLYRAFLPSSQRVSSPACK